MGVFESAASEHGVQRVRLEAFKDASEGVRWSFVAADKPVQDLRRLELFVDTGDLDFGHDVASTKLLSQQRAKIKACEESK